MNERIQRAKDENKHFEQKVTRLKMQSEENNRKSILEYEDYEKLKRKKLRITYNSMNKSFKEFKSERAEHWNMMRGRKADDSLRNEELKELMMEKRERS